MTVTTTTTGYLDGPYLAEEYLDVSALAAMGQQAEFFLTQPKNVGMQATLTPVFPNPVGMQAEIVIADVPHALGMQVEIIHIVAYGMQANISLYNTNRLRILCEFPSRGLSTAVGLNAWGNTAGTGQSWQTNSEEAGDFSVQNLNTDIVEQVWRSALGDIVGINLECDTERPQGVFVDTVGILGHNLTSSADIVLIGSNSPIFATIGVSIPLQARDDDPNIYYIAPTLPTSGYRYWRLSIDDASNPDNFLEIGTIVFGAAEIFFGECFVDQVEFQLRDFADLVNTEAFTNVMNSRAQKKVLRLDFQSLSYLKANFRIMRSMFRNERTVAKCLWIPTPDENNQEYTARFALFSKLSQIPTERHNHKGGAADYVSFTIELDESR